MSLRKIFERSVTLLVIAFLGSSCVAHKFTSRYGTHPPPKTELPTHTEVAYVKQKGHWYQLRVTLETPDAIPTPKDGTYVMRFNTTVSVRRFNRESGDYDIDMTKGGIRLKHSLNFRFEGDNDFRMSPNNWGGSVGGSAGWPNRNFTSVEVFASPNPGSGISVVDTTLTITAKATVEPTLRERERGVSDLAVALVRSWEIRVPSEKKVEFSEILPR